MQLEELRNERLKKLKRLRDAGVNPFPTSTRRTYDIAQTLRRFDALAEQRTTVTIAGRIMAQRGHGGLTFLDLNDGSGSMQALIGADQIGQGPYDFFLSVIDVGDFIEVTGVPVTTKRGERSIQAEAWGMLSKSIRPLPEKWHGLQDVEERYRQRAMDLLFNASVKERFERRFRIISFIRAFFEEHGFREVETPMLQSVPGGATARPFQTHLNALDIDLYLRVAPELYLKRLLVGGFERVFEIGRNFRNEGMDREHNPEFTMLEAYAAYQDHAWLMDLTERLMVRLVIETFGGPTFTYQGQSITVQRPFRRLLFSDLVREASGLDYDLASVEQLAARARELGVVVEKSMTKPILGDEIYKKTLRAKMTDPVFVVGHPLALSPLAKQINPGGDSVARFQLIMGGFELTNGFAELNDPVDQQQRFEAQQELREQGDEEAQRVDMDYVRALEYGMPPAAGIGIGLDRLVALLTDSHSLRDILLFPTMKPKDIE